MTTGLFAEPQRKTTRSVSEDGDDDDEDGVASINSLSIQVGDERDEDALGGNTNKSLDKGDQLPPPSSTKKASSLRNLLGVPPSSNGNKLTLPGSNSSSMGSMLGVPPSTSARTAPAGIGGASGAVIGGSGGKVVETLPSEIAPKRRKVVLGPGCSALDWARLKSTIPSQGFQKIKPSELKLHKSREDAWTSFNGKVYNLSPYLRFHPGGEDELMRVAGRDGTRLFSELDLSRLPIKTQMDTNR